jgi:hypothetical protein
LPENYFDVSLFWTFPASSSTIGWPITKSFSNESKLFPPLKPFYRQWLWIGHPKSISIWSDSIFTSNLTALFSLIQSNGKIYRFSKWKSSGELRPKSKKISIGKTNISIALRSG